MSPDEAKTLMLAKGECDELHCGHLFKRPATQEDPAEQDCLCKGACPYDEPAQARFAVIRGEIEEEALIESWEELVGPLEMLLGARREGQLISAAETLRRRANALIDAHTVKVLENRHEL
jgi:hypothetical protein